MLGRTEKVIQPNSRSRYREERPPGKSGLLSNNNKMMPWECVRARIGVWIDVPDAYETSALPEPLSLSEVIFGIGEHPASVSSMIRVPV